MCPNPNAPKRIQHRPAQSAPYQDHNRDRYPDMPWHIGFGGDRLHFDADNPASLLVYA
jgi:hypothetical protein